MSDRKGKVKSLGLTKGGISFRFSPENEEIEEIQLDDPTENKPSSLPESGGGGGDTSPLKEMLKHKWANKWEKRSLSLDLDLKGKIITAIEDKRKSIVSHFIPEETGILLPPSTSNIAEHIGYSGDSDNHQQQQQHLISGQISNSSKNLSLSDSNFDGFLDDGGDVEEIGLDYLDEDNQMSVDNHLDNLLKFNVSPEFLQEYYDGETPLYYQHPRNYDELPSIVNVKEISKEDLKPSSIFSNILSALINHEWTKYVLGVIAVALFLPYGFISSCMWILVGSFSIIICQESLQSSSSIPTAADVTASNNKSDSTDDKKTRVVKSTTTTTKADLSDATSSSRPSNLVVPPPPTIENSRLYITRSQGWMTEVEGDYDPFTCNIRQTRLIFVRLEGSMLYISYPHSKHRMQIPKRRLWNDPVISTDVQFVRHHVYNISGATVSIWPLKLARKRAWNKKYPIAIQCPGNSTLATISPSPSTEIGSLDTLDRNAETASTSSSSMPDKDKKNIEQKKEVTREDCSHKMIYLFSRSDREKDDWFRRLIAAAKIGSGNSDSPERLSSTLGDQEQDLLLQDYFDYMRKIIPSLGTEKLVDNHKSTSNSSKSDGKEKTNSSGMDKDSASKKDVTSDKSESNSSSSKLNTPTCSRKGSPTLDDSMGLEKILTIPQGPDFLNAFLGRIFHDFLRSPYWKAQVNDLIQKKLNYMRRPQFLETLLVRELDLGSTIPIIQRASDPVIDKQGLWIDLDLSYDGNIVVTLETKLNLLKLRKSPSQETPDETVGNGSPNSFSSSSIIPTANFSNASDTVSVSTKQSQNSSSSSAGPTGNTMINSGTSSGEVPPSTTSSTMTINQSNSSTPTGHQARIFDSDADDSGESSEDEINPDDFLKKIAQSNDPSSKDDQQNTSESSSGNSGASKGMKILKMAEKLASSKYVQQATDLKVVKKAIANVANTPLVLSVELKSLMGTLALNIPSPPSDRLWMGFRNNPSMQISARPKFGARAVNLTQVTDWIQKKLLHEFQRVIVFPNMNDVTIPLMEFKLPK